MRYLRTSAFERSFRSLPQDRRDRVLESLEKLDRLLTRHTHPEGLGLKQLRHGIWEIRAGLSDRILFQRRGEIVEFLIVGNHDEIRRALKRL